MSFEIPLYLWGLLAASVPIAIHLFNRRRAERKPFAAIEFILRSRKNLIRRMKLRQFLVLLARIALLLVLAFALAKPFTHTDRLRAFSSEAPTATVYVFDNSWSMVASDGETSNLERARKRLEEMLRRTRGDEMVALVIASRPASAPVSRLTYDVTRLRESLAALSLSTRQTDMLGALRLADSILSKAPRHLQREIVVISDHSRHVWDRVEAPWGLGAAPNVRFESIAPAKSRENIAIEDVQVEPAPDVSPRHFNVTVRVANYSSRPFFKPVEIEIDNRTIKGYFEQPLAPGKSASKRFLIKVEGKGDRIGYARIPADALGFDNQLPFQVRRRRSISVVLVNGAPRTVPYLDESYFVSLALRPRSDAPTQLRVQTIRPDELATFSLAEVDVLFWLNVAAPPDAVVRRVARFVEKGGGLLITAGSNVTPEYNRALKALLPYSIRGLKVVVDPKSPDAKLRALLFGKIAAHHPLFSAFPPGRRLLAGHTSQYLLLERRLGDSRVLLSFDNGSPALVERRLKVGRVFFLTTTTDLDWSDFAIQAGFLPFLHQAARVLGGGTHVLGPSRVYVHQEFPIRVEKNVESIAVTAPNGRIRRFTSSHWGRARNLVFRDTALPGVYVVEQATSGSRRRITSRFVVRLGQADSDLRLADVSAIKKRLRLSAPVRGKTLAGRDRSQPKQRLNLWPFAILAVVLLLFAETALAAKR